MVIEIFYQRRKFEAASASMTGAELRALFTVPAADDLFRAQGNRTEGPKIGDTDVVPLKNGEHFTSIPSDISGGSVAATTLLPRLRREIDRINEELFPAEVREAGGAKVIVVTVEDDAWMPRPLRVLVRIPALYADEKPDLIFLEPGATWSGGAIPRVMGAFEFDGAQWIQISWHWNGPFDPAQDNLVRFVRSIAKFLAVPQA